MNMKQRAVPTSGLVATIAVVLGLSSLAAAQQALTTIDAIDTTAIEDAAALSLFTDWSTVRYLSDGSESVEAPQGWRFTIGVPLWVPGIDGDVTVKGLTFTFDQDTTDVLEALDAHLNFAISLHVEAQKDRLGVFADGMYLNVGADHDTALGTTIEGSVEGFIAELGILYTVYTTQAVTRTVPLRVDALGGVRLTGIGVDVETENVGSVSQSKTLYDPFIGLRGEIGLLKWLSIKARGDIGGFDMIEGHSSKLTWNASAAASFHLATWCNLDLGYRWLSYDHEDGSGSDRFALDTVFHGPLIEIDFKL